MRPRFPDDASGEGFRAVLEAIRRDRPKPARLRKRVRPAVGWIRDRLPAFGPAAAQAWAVVGDYRLHVVEMNYYVALLQPSGTPRITWALGPDDEEDFEPFAAGPAPTLVAAMKRAERAVMVRLGFEEG